MSFFLNLSINNIQRVWRTFRRFYQIIVVSLNTYIWPPCN
nr:MAG TPA: hypothetical protein [Caudoviricetes sp.]